MECWPRFINPAKEPNGQYPGWPITINQLDNYHRKAAGWLPHLKFENMNDSLVRVFSEKDNQLIYALRVKGNEFDPPVFDEKITYRLEIGDPDNGEMKVFENLNVAKKPGKSILIIQ
jgi:hypothetical protein